MQLCSHHHGAMDFLLHVRQGVYAMDGMYLRACVCVSHTLRSVSHISASAASQSVSAGDAGVAGCEVSARTVQTTLLDLAARLPER